MKTQLDAPRSSGLLFMSVLALAVICANAFIGYRAQRERARKRCEAQIAGWLAGPKLMTYVIMERYGPPDSLTAQAASWFDKGPWKRIVVHSQRLNTYLEQAVGYRMDPEAAQSIAAMGAGVKVDRVNDEISARSDSEPLNLLALNLANEVAQRRLSAAQARETFDKTANLSVSGKASPYLEGLMFEPYRPPVSGQWGESEAY